MPFFFFLSSLLFWLHAAERLKFIKPSKGMFSHPWSGATEANLGVMDGRLSLPCQSQQS